MGGRRGNPRRRQQRFTAGALVLGLLLAAALCEIVLRLQTRSDLNGNLFVGDVHLRPFQPPTEKLRRRLRSIREFSQAYTVYDADLGWAPAPRGRSADGLFEANRAGYRAASAEAPVATTAPEPGVRRIAVFGDSFTHGDEVRFQETWPEQLALRLRERGGQAEVLNFGVSGYGVDQAFLRWRKHGRRYNPSLVVLGFAPTDVKRNLNLIRLFYSPNSGIPFSKPRFLLGADDALRLINVPTPPLEALPQLITNFETWPLHRHETYYRPADYVASWWSGSRLLALLHASFLAPERPDPFAPGSEGYALTLAIARAFRQEVEATGASFLVVHLPGVYELRPVLEGSALRYEELAAALASEGNFIDPLPALVRAAEARSLDVLIQKRHYSPEGNRVVAQVIADAIAEARPQ